MEERKLEHKPLRERTRVRPEHAQSEDEIIRAFAENKRKGTEKLIEAIAQSPIAQYRLRGPKEI